MSFTNKIRQYFYSTENKKNSTRYRDFNSYSASITQQYQRSNLEYSKIAQEAFSQNVIAHRAIMLVSQGAASVPWKLHQVKANDKIEITQHPLLNLLHKPNPSLGGAEFFENIFAYKMISGNAYIHALGKDHQAPRELHILRPDRVTIVPGNSGVAHAYLYKVGEIERSYPVNKITGQGSVLHLRNFNPLDDWYGLSSIEAAAFAIDQHNQASVWNQSLLRNGARPSGALVMKGIGNDPNSYFLDDEERDRLRFDFDNVFAGGKNAGRPVLLQGGLEWQEMSISPKDMDFIESKNTASREIALALGVPPQLLGIPGDNTYSNMQEARLALWEETIIPLLDHLIDSLNNWLVPMFGNDLQLSYNIDEVSGLAQKREKLWSRIEQASFLTINEKRKIVGLSPIDGGDNL
jgi:HK97 family phage portal protein